MLIKVFGEFLNPLMIVGLCDNHVNQYYGLFNLKCKTVIKGTAIQMSDHSSYYWEDKTQDEVAEEINKQLRGV